MTKRQIKKKLDDAVSLLVRQSPCAVCGKTDYLNAHHIVGRRNETLRWDLRNLVSLCAGHHTFKTESAHQDPVWFDQWLEKNRPDDLIYLQETRNKVLKRTTKDLEELLEELLDKFDE